MSFTADTQVLLANGTTAALSQVDLDWIEMEGASDTELFQAGDN